MENIKRVLLLSLLLTIASVSSSNLYEIADRLLQELKSSVQESLDVNLPVLQELPNKLLSIGNSLSVSAESDIVVYKTQVMKQINDLIAEAEELGYVDLQLLANCTDKNVPELDLLHVIVMYQIDNCINETTQYGTSLVLQAIQNIQNTENSVQRLELYLDQCSLIGTEECVITVIDAISVALVDLPARISEDSIKTQAVVKALESTYSACAVDRVGIVQELGQELVNNIRICANMPV